MEPVYFDHVNVISGTERPIPIRNGGNRVLSCWRPTLAERLSILFSGRVWLDMQCGTQPPTCITGKRKLNGLPKNARRSG